MEKFHTNFETNLFQQFSICKCVTIRKIIKLHLREKLKPKPKHFIQTSAKHSQWASKHYSISSTYS